MLADGVGADQPRNADAIIKRHLAEHGKNMAINHIGPGTTADVDRMAKLFLQASTVDALELLSVFGPGIRQNLDNVLLSNRNELTRQFEHSA